MPEVDRQVRQPLLDIATLPMPSREAAHCEGVSERMKGWRALPRRRLDASMAQQSPKRAVRRDVIQRPTQAIGEERDRCAAVHGRRACGEIDT